VQGTYSNIRPFNLHRPITVAEVCALADEHGDGAVFMAGGVDLLQGLKAGQEFEHLIYLKSVPELHQIEVAGDTLRLGACVSHSVIEQDPGIAKLNPEISSIWREIANPRIRIAGTIGGNILASNPNYDGLPALIALDAVAVFEGVAAQRIPVGEIGHAPEGLLTAIEIPNISTSRFAFDRSLKPAVSVAVAAVVDGGVDNGMLRSARVGIGCAFGAPVGGALALDAGVTAAQINDVARAYAEDLPTPIDNVFASAAYRRRMIGVLIARQLRTLAGV
jgi:carbon-monoxide dehydrogenase medium subunit